MMNDSMQNKLTVLKKLAHRLNEEGITWALGASMLLYFKGVVPDFHDIDLMIINEDADCVKTIFSEMGELQPPNPNDKYQTKTFLEFIIDGVDVDVMAGFAIVKDGAVIDCSLQRDQITEIMDLDGEHIPLQSLTLWSRYYDLMGRSAKSALIEQYLNKQI
ncbi:hypothetical protein [Brotaphodocola sp.]|uniref:hypothetical protein n=1 Tax=Brotaphodocola sp. TaxID=3073577 RepID=UPI003D7F1431